jgi:hypothetical protein
MAKGTKIVQYDNYGNLIYCAPKLEFMKNRLPKLKGFHEISLPVPKVNLR